MPSESNKPSYTRPELTAIKKDLDLVADLLAGTRTMQDKSATYIKKWPDEKDAVYKFRRESENVFDGLGRTLSAATGMLFAKAPGMEWNASETAISPLWDNIDAAGTKGTVLVKRFAEASIRDGLGIIVVDHPSAPEGEVVTAANEKALGLRPTWAIYSRAQAINWREAVINNERKLTLLVLSEAANLEDGDYGIVSKQRYRVLRLLNGVATWELWEESDNQQGEKTYKLVASGTFRNAKGKDADFLPVAVAYTGRTDAVMTATIPLLGVANSNLAHWQISTDLRFNRSVVGFDQLVVKGELAKDKNGIPYPLQMGPLTAIQVEVAGDAGWKGPTGTGLDQLAKGREEKTVEMAQQGLSFLQTDTRAAETAEAKRLDASAENSTLATAAQGIEDAVNMALEYTAWYLGIEKEGAPVLSISRDYEDTSMQADMLTAWVGAISNAGLPRRLLLEAMQVGGLIGPDEDLDALEAEMEVNAQAAADAKAAELEAQSGMQGKGGMPDKGSMPSQMAA